VSFLGHMDEAEVNGTERVDRAVRRISKSSWGGAQLSDEILYRWTKWARSFQNRIFISLDLYP
jgi:hypothetical protein